MSLDAIGHVTLGGTTFSTDPQVYEPANWEKRASVSLGIGGSVTIQDFGTFQKDNTLRLASGAAGFLDLDTVKSLHTKYRTKGAAYALTDWLGNEFTVFILDFKPVPTFIGDLHTYEMSLQVTAISKLFGETYTGD